MSHSQSCLPLLRAVEACNSRLGLLCPPRWASGSATAWGAGRRGWAAVLSAPRPGLGSGEGGLGRAVEGAEGEGPVDGEGAEGHVLEWLTPQGQKAKQTLTDTPWEMRPAGAEGEGRGQTQERMGSWSRQPCASREICFAVPAHPQPSVRRRTGRRNVWIGTMATRNMAVFPQPTAGQSLCRTQTLSSSLPAQCPFLHRSPD